MSRSGREGQSRSDISGTLEKSRGDMQEKGRELEVDTRDIEITRETLERLEGGTEEGAGEVIGHIEQAESLTEGKFESDGRELEDVHGEGEAFQDDLEDSAGSVERDIHSIDDATESIETPENLSEMDRARQSATEDKDFLDRHVEDVDEALEQSRADYEELRRRVQS